MDNSKLLRILFLEDNITEINLIENFLRVSLPEFEIKNARTEKEFLKFILRFKPDVILSGYQLEKYSSSQAFELLREGNHNIPLIIISNKLSDDISTGLVKKGIEDCISLTNLGLLPASIIKAVEKKNINQQKYNAELELKTEKERRVTIFNNTPEAIINIGFKGEILEINPTGLGILQVEGQSKLKNKNITADRLISV